MLKRESIQPLYRQLMEELTTLIDKGIYQSGQQIPTEPELAEQYGVSRITVRRTVEEMCKLGYLVKRQGKGTFVKPPKVFRKFIQDKSVSFAEACKRNNYRPSSKTTFLKIEKAEGDNAEQFNLTAEDDILRLQRLWSADNTPLMLIDIYMNPESYPDFNASIIDQKNFFEYLNEQYGVTLSTEELTSVTCTNATYEQAEVLHTSIGEPLLVFEHFGRNQDGQVVFFTRQFIVGSRYKANI